ncbi:hypothetical protein [Streptomyces sp. NPDC006638]|uniref:hypothetical protein n=1 Tax=Streptomyces sp. NPDC006638 TaxID=3157183 RepID=UPI00339DB385
MSGYREERRADEAMEREQRRKDREVALANQLEGQRLAAEEKRRSEDAAEERRQKAADAAAERRRRDAAEKRRQELADKKQREQDKARKAAARSARISKAGRWIAANQVSVFVGFVMASSVIPAVISQVDALGGAGVFVLLAALLSAMLEGGAWALTFMGKAAEDAGRPAGKYRVGTWCTALVAAAVQYWHWAEKLPDHIWVACVFAASSLFAIYLWDMKTHGSHGLTKEERREAKARKAHLKARKKHHQATAKLADRLISSAPFGALDEEAAFAAAWRIEKGTEPGMTPELYATATASRLRLGKAFEAAETSAPEMTRARLMTGLFNPVPGRLSDGMPTLGPSVPVPALTQGFQGPTGQAGIGPYGSEDGSKTGPKTNSTEGSETGAKRRSDEELETLLPEAHRVAVDLVAEGKQISATSLAKRMKIRREDGMWLRDRVIAERKIRLIDGSAA